MIHNHDPCWFDSPTVVVGEGWWVTGRRCRYNEKTSEIFDDKRWEWIEGPQHPAWQSTGSCYANVNATHTLYTGGDPTFTESWLYDWTAGVWTRTGDLNEGRQSHGCAVLPGQGVVVAGGYNTITTFNYVFSVELYDPQTGNWILQPRLPEDTYHTELITWENSILALFYKDDQVYLREEDCSWSPMEGVHLPKPFYGDAVTIVPDDFANGCM